jgi:hypothetical protein
MRPYLFSLARVTDICPLVQILLQKSFWGDERKFLGPLVRFVRGDVRDSAGDLSNAVESARTLLVGVEAVTGANGLCVTNLGRDCCVIQAPG